jgi:hypothetical protein
MDNAVSHNYLIPRLHGSFWDAPGATGYSADLDWPRVSIYCPHPEPERPWLLGSFELNPHLAPVAGSGPDYWSWSLNYPTGDGFMIHLNRQGAGVSDTQNLAGDVIRDRDAETARLKAALAASDMATALRTSQEIETADAVTRARIPLRCNTCRLPRVYRLEKLHPIISRFWTLGFREVPYPQFVALVDDTLR